MLACLVYPYTNYAVGGSISFVFRFCALRAQKRNTDIIKRTMLPQAKMLLLMQEKPHRKPHNVSRAKAILIEKPPGFEPHLDLRQHDQPNDADQDGVDRHTR